jgi:hypothetical protein
MECRVFQCVYPELGRKVAMESAVDRLLLLSATRCDVSIELGFIASHFYDFLCHRDALNAALFSMISEILSH